MAFPTFRSSSTGTNIGDDPTITLPATVSSGDLLIVVFGTDGAPTLTWDDSSEGTWSEEGAYTNQDSAVSAAVYAKVADGTEGGNTLSPTLSASERSGYICAAIQDWGGALSNLTVEIAAGGVTGEPDPGSVSATGAADNLFIAGYVADHGTNMNPSTYPYADNNLSAFDSSSAGVSMALCSDELTTASADPGTFDVTSVFTDQVVVFSMAVDPDAGGGGGGSVPLSGNGLISAPLVGGGLVR